MFSRDFCKWGFIGGLYEVTATAAIRMGAILSRKDFLDRGIYVAIGPEDLAELFVRERPFQLLQVPMPDPRAAMKQRGNGRIIV